ncbi:hypothetical protein EXIGLDRAFT_735598 [Exidia glandulosa HHB12029]|nr:hypothetical protein EXIGLDRAFT_735598 [Exidia glandulosa HHB12029]
MVVLETASNIIVPDMGDPWRRLREDDFSGVDLSTVSAALVSLIRQMMRRAPGERPDMDAVCAHYVVRRAREAMDRRKGAAAAGILDASPLASEPEGFLEELLSGFTDC